MKDVRLNKCDECGLPLLVCNALAAYRNAVKYYALGRAADGEAFARMAAEDEAEWRVLANEQDK